MVQGPGQCRPTALLKLGLTPNMVTVIGCVGHVGVFWCAYKALFLPASLLLLIFSMLDFFDGTMARMITDGKGFYGIDPNGMLGPIELECVRFIRNDVRNHPSFGFERRYEILLHSFSRFVDIGRLQDIFIIDMAYCTFNSVFENDDPKETYDDLELIRIAKKWKNRLT